MVAASTAGAADERGLKLSVKLGVSYLKKAQQQDGSWLYGGSQNLEGAVGQIPKNVGATALAGLALLTSGAGGDDPAVQKAAQLVREASLIITYTYSVSLCVMFLDRLGEPEDVPLIESLMVRLLAGQRADGMWSYECPPISRSESVRLKKIIDRGRQGTSIASSSKGKRTYKDLPSEIKRQLSVVDQMSPVGDQPGDNSNTQFAMFALWMGRRHGIPVKRAFTRCRNHFRKTQLPDGSWGYHSSGTPGPREMQAPRPSMTCAGLLGLALVYGLANDATAQFDATSTRDKDPTPRKGAKPADPTKDPTLLAGFIALATGVDKVFAGAGQKAVPLQGNKENVTDNYFLFSLERVAVIYGLETIGRKDWYELGANSLLTTQNSDGSWREKFCGNVAATSFALLFLNRANLVPDLTVVLGGRVQDPGLKKQ
jgi:hypothetical protein